jgi:CheY-like chemotaxis protein
MRASMVNILLMEDNPDDVRLISGMLEGERLAGHDLMVEGTLLDGKRRSLNIK